MWLRQRSMVAVRISILMAILTMLCTPVHAQSQTPYGFWPHPAVDDQSGFVPIFNGRTLDGWSGDSTYWSVEHGSIVGKTTPSTLLKDHNNFIVWRGGAVRDFELRLRYRISSDGNSGVNYRSEDVPEIKGAMRGYQFDIDGSGAARVSRQIMAERGIKWPSFSVPGKLVEPPSEPRLTGNIYEELGRGVLAMAGTLGLTSPAAGARVDALLGDETIVARLARAAWNDVRIIARGNEIIHVLNGRVVAILIDNDDQQRQSGLLGLQAHVGPPSEVEFKDIRLKRFE